MRIPEAVWTEMSPSAKLRLLAHYIRTEATPGTFHMGTWGKAVVDSDDPENGGEQLDDDEQGCVAHWGFLLFEGWRPRVESWEVAEEGARILGITPHQADSLFTRYEHSCDIEKNAQRIERYAEAMDPK